MMSGTDRGEIDFRNLLDALRVHSVIQDPEHERWEEMLKEWKHFRHYADDDICLCGKKHIVYCHEVQHRETGMVMGPIGSKCIERFDVEVKIDAEIAEKDATAKIKHEKDGNLIVPPNFKKHRNKTRVQVWRADPGYIVWMLDNERVKKKTDRKWFTTQQNMS
jgi:hypothetical protein